MIITYELNIPAIAKIIAPFLIVLILSLDAILLHIRYWLLNRDSILKVSDECIEIHRSGNTIRVIPRDIEKIELHLTRQFFDYGPIWSPGEEYSYALIF